MQVSYYHSTKPRYQRIIRHNYLYVAEDMLQGLSYVFHPEDQPYMSCIDRMQIQKVKLFL